MKLAPHQTYQDQTLTVINHSDIPVFVNYDGIDSAAKTATHDVPALFGDSIKIVMASAQQILRTLSERMIALPAIEDSAATIITLCSNTRIGDARADLDPSSPLNRLKRSEEILTEQGFKKMMKMPDGNAVWERGRWSADITDIPTTENQPPAFYIQYRGVL